MSAYVVLFWAALGSATILPFYSEFLLIALFERGLDPFWLWFAATAGNTLGALVNWVIGVHLTQYSDRRWFPFKEKHLHRAQGWFQKYGVWTLLLSWMPVGGDALTFVAGMMRVRFALFMVLVSIGKGLRYLIVIVGLSTFA